jgi:hypothetical protein
MTSHCATAGPRDQSAVEVNGSPRPTSATWAPQIAVMSADHHIVAVRSL